MKNLDQIETNAWLVAKSRADYRMALALKKLAVKRAKLDAEEVAIRDRHSADMRDSERFAKAARWDAELSA